MPALLGEHGRDAREPEHDEAGLEHELASEPVGHRSHRQEQSREGEDVGVDDPLELRPRRAEVALEARERDVQDRVVEPDQKQAEAEHCQHAPAPRIRRLDLAWRRRPGSRVHGTSLLRDATATELRPRTMPPNEPQQCRIEKSRDESVNPAGLAQAARRDAELSAASAESARSTATTPSRYTGSSSRPSSSKAWCA